MSDGKGLFWKPIDERVEHKSDGIVYEFVDYWDKFNKVRLWQKSNEANVLHLVWKDVTDFSVDDLKVFGIWDSLNATLKNDIENSVITKTDVYNKAHPEDKIVKHHKSREEYVGVPRSFVCVSCCKTQEISPAIVVNKAKAKGITVEEFEKTWTCAKCNPAPRGKKANPKYAGLAKVLRCTAENCSFEKKQHPSMTQKAADLVGLSYEAYVSSYKCKAHRVKKMHHFTKMRLEREKNEKNGEITPPKTAKKREEISGEVKRRGRAANPEYANFPKGYTCCVDGCGCFQVIHPSLVIKAAKAKGISVEEMYKNWKCKEHRKEV